MTTLQKGMNAPEFALKDKNGTTHSLKAVKTKYTVVFFYPKDDTPGCTIEAKELSGALTAFTKAGVTVFGVSGGDEKTKEKFCAKYGLKVTLLSDPDFSVASAYGSYGEKMFMGRTYLGILRNTFLLDNQKRVVRVFEGVKPEGHAAELLAAVKLLESGADQISEGSARPERSPHRTVRQPKPAASTKTKVEKLGRGKTKKATNIGGKKTAKKAAQGTKKKSKAMKSVERRPATKKVATKKKVARKK